MNVIFPADIFENISPFDYRYATGSEIKKFFSENARIKYQTMVESALARIFARKGICSRRVAEEIEKAAMEVSAQEVYGEEKIIKHDVRALVNCIRRRVSNESKPFVHLAATSYDIVDTANSKRYKDAAEQLLLPVLLELEKTLIEIALREKNTLQIGRTHGQHAEPITFGYSIACYVSRLGARIREIESKKNALVGKFSGAVGTYNASSLVFENPMGLENELMQELGLKASNSSTQIIEPEPLTDLMHSVVSTFSVIANLADDLRHLQRSEISEIAESFGAKQVGSSTMPHKRNPISFENIKSFWKAFMPRMTTVYLDQLSEHQRDLTNSASQRFLGEIIIGLVVSAERLNATLKNLVVDKKNMEKNFENSKKHSVAEPLYIFLALHGHENAHEAVREISLEAEKNGKTIFEIAKAKKELKPFFEKFSGKQKEILENPEKYVGLAEKKTEQICGHWKKELSI